MFLDYSLMVIRDVGVYYRSVMRCCSLDVQFAVNILNLVLHKHFLETQSHTEVTLRVAYQHRYLFHSQTPLFRATPATLPA
jgi:hypothetical protein